MATPVQSRVASAGRQGYFGVSGLRDFRDFFTPEEMASVFYEWRTLPVTVKMVRALQDLALSSPSIPGLSAQDVPVQYGITLGIALAVQLLSDPSQIVTGLFGSRPQDSAGMPPESFEEASEAS